MSKLFSADFHQRRLLGTAPLFGIYGAVVLAAYGFLMFNVTLAGDDWQVLSTYGFGYDLNVAAGRWMAVVIWRLFDDNNFAPPFTLSVLCGAYLVFSIACCVCLGVRRPGSYLAFACVLVCFPFNAEAFSFKTLHMSLAIGILLATGSGLMMVIGHARLWNGERTIPAILAIVSAFAFALSASTYQSLALFACAIVLLRALGLSRHANPAVESLRIGLLLGFSGAAVVCGLLLYFLSIHLVSRALDVPLIAKGNYAVVDSFVRGFGELLNRIGENLLALIGLLFDRQPLFPPIVKFIFVGTAAILLGAFVRGLDRYGEAGGRHPREDFKRAAIFLCVLLLLLLLPLTIGMATRLVGNRYNNLIGFGIAYATVFTLLYETPRRDSWRTACAGLVMIVVAIFVFQQNRASVTTYLLNRRDLAIANRMLERITASPKFAPFAAKRDVSITFYGDRLDDRGLSRPFSYGHTTHAKPSSAIMDCGIFNCKTSHAARLFGLISDTNLRFRTTVWPVVSAEVTAAERQSLKERIKTAHAWPAAGSVIFGEHVIVIMLQSP